MVIVTYESVFVKTFIQIISKMIFLKIEVLGRFES